MNGNPPPSEVVASIIRHDLHAMTRMVFKTVKPRNLFEPSWHVEAMTHALTVAGRENDARLLITVPPRSLKSICAAVAFPAWMIGRYPGLRFMVASYGNDFASQHARDFRKVLAAPWYRYTFPGVQLSKDTEMEVVTTQNGGREAVSLGGSVTGKGADFLIIDDLMKAGDASSATERQRVIDFFQGTLASRIDDKRKFKMVVVQQRLHEEDLIGFLLAQNEAYKHLDLPAIAQCDEDIPVSDCRVHRRLRGAALSPLEPLATLEEIRLRIGPANFSAQYLQNPTAANGNLVRWDRIQRYSHAPPREEMQTVVQSWDTASALSEGADFSVCTTWGRYEDVWLLLELHKCKLPFQDLVGLVGVLRRKWRAETILIESHGSGIPLIQQLASERALEMPLRSRRDAPKLWRVHPYHPKTDKITRFASQLFKLEEGAAKLPSEASWLTDLHREMTAFPRGRHDDQVDSISQFLDAFGARGPSRERPRVRVATF